MPDITIRVVSGAVMGKMKNIRAQVPVVGEKHIEDTEKRVVKQMQSYPPERAGQTYNRTYRFKNSWRITKQARGFKLENTAAAKSRRYGNYVVGDAVGKGQAWMHVGRWLLFRDVVDYEMTKLPDLVEQNLKLVIRQNGLSK